MRVKFFLKLLSLGLGFLGLIISCTKLQQQDYVVILWSTHKELLTGGVYPVFTTYPGGDYSILTTEGRKDIAQWRARLFSEKQAAQAFVEEIQDYTRTFGKSLSYGLPVRQQPDNVRGRILTTLHTDQIVKVIQRASPELQLSSRIKGSWYRILTSEGIEGYVFDYNLLLFDHDVKDLLTLETTIPQEIQDLLFHSVWRPSYFRTMLANKTLDRTLFKEEFYLIIDPQTQTLSLTLPQDPPRLWSYTKITALGHQQYVFEPLGFRVTLDTENASLHLTYTTEDKSTRFQEFIILKTPLKEILEQDAQSRFQRWEALLAKGPAFTSLGYGNLSLQKDRGFIWQNYHRLLTLFPDLEHTPGYGYISLDKFLHPRLQNTYFGVLSFVFAALHQGEEPLVLDFAVHLLEDGLRLYHLPPSYFQENIALRDKPQSLIIAFQSQKSEVSPEELSLPEETSSGAIS